MRSVLNQSLLKRVAIVLPVTFVGLFASANAYGAIINLDNTINNASFELGNQTVGQPGCPVDWACGGSPDPGFTSYVPGLAQFTPGADGIAGFTPNGNWAGASPTPSSPGSAGSGTLMQTIVPTVTYAANTIYVVDLWVGTPMTEMDGTTPVLGSVSTLNASFLAGGGAGSGETINLLSTTNPAGECTGCGTAPAVGQWQLYVLSLDTSVDTAAVGQSIGFSLFADSSPPNNNAQHVANFDIGSAVPEPASFALLGLGLVGLGVARKKLHR